MMIFTIEQHVEMLNNSKHYLKQQRSTLERMRASVERTEKDVAAYEEMINAARKKGIDAFDREKFGKKRRAR